MIHLRKSRNLPGHPGRRAGSEPPEGRATTSAVDSTGAAPSRPKTPPGFRTGGLERLANFILGHRLLVALSWLMLFVAGVAGAGAATNRLTFDFSMPGQPSDNTEKQVLAQYGVSTLDTLLPVLTAPDGSTVAQSRERFTAVFQALRVELPQARVVDLGSTGDARFITDDGRKTFALVQGPMATGFGPGIQADAEPVLREQAKRAGLDVTLTSYTLLSEGGDTAGDPSVLAETLLGGLGALAVLVFVFASFLALIPLLIAAVSILTTFLLVLGLTYVTDVNFVVAFLVALVGLGVSIDYSLLVVSRWREERAHGHSNDDAIRIAVRTAGHAVLASGVTVAISLVALVVLPLPFLRSIGFGGLLIPLVSVAVVLTLLPALLSKIGPRVDFPRIRKEGAPARGWLAWAGMIVRHRFIAAAVALGALALLLTPVFDLKIGQPASASLARGGPAYQALQTLRQAGVGTGVLTPVEVLVRADQASTAAAAARDVPGVRMAVVGGTRHGSAIIDVLPEKETVDNASNAVVAKVRDAVDGAVEGPVGITGTGAAVVDYYNAVYKNFPYVLVLISLITFLLLVRTFRSVLLPLKAVLLNVVSLAAVFGAVVFFWQQGHGSGALFNTSATGATNFWLPIIIFAFLFGLSMDYEVFILSRMREEYDATGSTSRAVVTGLARTGRLVTSAALILFFAFAALASAPGTDIKVLGTALGVGILIDATIVRALLVPALVSAFGRYNWWLPTWLARVLRVESSPLPPRSEQKPPPARPPDLGVGDNDEPLPPDVAPDQLAPV